MKPDTQDRWKIRRTLIVSMILFGMVMIVAGAIGIFGGLFAGELVYGGVTLITAILSAYAGFATWDDKNNSDGSVTPDG